LASLVFVVSSNMAIQIFRRAEVWGFVRNRYSNDMAFNAMVYSGELRDRLYDAEFAL